MTSRRDSINRRRFIQLGATGTSLAMTSPTSAASPQMRYRSLGNTGLKVSEISFGTYGFDNPALLSAALDAGINFICTCADYQDGQAERTVGKAIAAIGSSLRDKLVIHTGATIRPGRSKKDILQSLDESLRRLQTDRVEVFRTSDVDDPDRVRLDELFEAYEEAKQVGKALHLGLSGHGRKLPGCLQQAIDDGRFDLIMCRYDFISYMEEQERLFSRAARQGMGVAVFKVSAGERQKEIRNLETRGLSFRQATVKWALSNPDVTSVCAGITSFDEIDEYCGAIGKSLEKSEAEMLERYANTMYSQYCRNCGTCEPSCPNDVAVADIMRYAMYFKYYGREKDSMRLYSSMPSQNRAGPCFSCDGVCHGSCPYGRLIREELVEAHEMLT